MPRAAHRVKLVLLIAGALGVGAFALAPGKQRASIATGPADPAIAPLLATNPEWADEFVDRPEPPEWVRGYEPVANAIGNRLLYGNHEVEVYIDQTYFGRDLLSWHQHEIKLGAQRMTPADRARVDALIAREQPNAAVIAALQRAGWVSTLLRSRKSILYGYIETRLRWDGNSSGWPAFWLLPVKRGWPPEIDILEIPGDGIAHQTLHTQPHDPPPHPGVKTPITLGFHTYGVLWQPDWISFYVDRKRTACFATPSDMHQAMYPILNLAVGGWAHAPDSSTASPMTMDVNYVRWWSLPTAGRNGFGADGNLPPADCKPVPAK